MMAKIFSRLASMPRSEMMKPRACPLDPENTFLRIEFDAICLEFSKGLFKIGDKVASLFGFNYDVVDVDLNGPPDEVPEAVEHTVLVSFPNVLQTERH